MMSLKLLMIITKTVCGVFALACNVIKLFELLVVINQAYWSMDLFFMKIGPWTLIWHSAATSVIINLIV